MRQQTLSKSALNQSSDIGNCKKSMVTPPNIKRRYPKGRNQHRIRHTEGGGVCVVRTIAIVIQGHVQLQMVFDPSYYK